MNIRRFKEKDAEALAELSNIASKELKWWEKENSKDFLKFLIKIKI